MILGIFKAKTAYKDFELKNVESNYIFIFYCLLFGVNYKDMKLF